MPHNRNNTLIGKFRPGKLEMQHVIATVAVSLLLTLAAHDDP
jgi:hypothetical protein